MFDIFYIGDNPELKENLPLATKVNSKKDVSANTKMYWLVDANIRILDYSIFEYRPPVYDQQYTHKWKYKTQEITGLQLIPKSKSLGTKDLYTPVFRKVFDILYTSTPEEYFQNNNTASYVWCIDPEYKISDNIDWVPSDNEPDFIHCFHLANQLQHKYPEKEGGAKLYPRAWKNAKIKYHTALDVFSGYPIIRQLTPGTYFDDNPDENFVWCADPEYDFVGKIDWLPTVFDQEYIHIFKIKGQLEYKYPLDIEAPWDNRCGGVKLYPRNYDQSKAKYQHVLEPQFPVFKTLDPTSVTTDADFFWCMDPEYRIDKLPTWLPMHEKEFIHVFKIKDQLEHKYPLNVVEPWDNRCGGLVLYPSDWENSKIKYQGMMHSSIEWERFKTEEEGREKSTHAWFWVVDDDVEPLADFDWAFQPAVFDNVTHVWQKLNPVTGRQYDYDGVKLCPKEASDKKRPKYMRQPASKQKEYPIYYLAPSDYDLPLQRVYERLSKQTDEDMFWVVDVYTQISSDFAFDYYPTQWDKHNVHVFQNADGSYKSVRLVPKATFLESTYTDHEIANNSFDNLKLINTEASTKPRWPVIDLTAMDKDTFVETLKEIETPFVWTIDSDVTANTKVLNDGFMPNITDLKKVHCWQKSNAITKQTHSYGGLRLWPTSEDYSYLTSSSIKLNRIKNMVYVKEPGATIKAYSIAFISYKDDDAERKYKKLCNHVGSTMDVTWIKDVEGIFAAHQEAANQISSDMFWVVDSDAIVEDDFNFSYIPDVYDKEVVHVWASKNPVNNLEYGYGGVKLFPTQIVRDATSWGLDFTTGLSTRFKAIPEISCVTAFNTSELETWRSAFRECVKLAVSKDPDAPGRLSAWLSPSEDAAFSEYAKLGAKQGKEFGIQYKHDINQLNNINNFNWLTEKFKECQI